jgi:hypothetical protein
VLKPGLIDIQGEKDRYAEAGDAVSERRIAVAHPVGIVAIEVWLGRQELES